MSLSAKSRRLPHFRAACRRTIKWGGLVLALLLAGMWIRDAMWAPIHVAGAWGVLCEPGTVAVVRAPSTYLMKSDGSGREERFILAVKAGTTTHRKTMRFWRAPIWMILAGTLVATAGTWGLDALARRRRRAGLCPKCRYDRTGLAASAVCPECGSRPNDAPSASNEPRTK